MKEKHPPVTFEKLVENSGVNLTPHVTMFFEFLANNEKDPSQTKISKEAAHQNFGDNIS